MHSPSIFAHILKQSLKRRSDDNFLFYSKQDKESIELLFDYAILRCGLLSHTHLLEQNLTVLPDDHHQFTDNYDCELIGQFIRRSGIDPQYIDNPERLGFLFEHLPEDEKVIDNKLFCGIALTEEELKSASPKQKRLQVSSDLEL